MISRSVKDRPEIILAANYHAYAGRVEVYWNGTPPESAEEPYGIALLQEQLTELESQGKQDSSDNRELSAALERLKKLGEPEFANALLWENLFNNWGGAYDAVSAVRSADLCYRPGVRSGTLQRYG